MAERLKDLEKREEAGAFRDLSHRELQVLALVARGQSNRQIGGNLGLSEVTVRNYVSTLLEKLALRNRVELATYAVQNRIFEKLNSV
jgi:DNA-binding NarL/FixJ family response regulator